MKLKFFIKFKLLFLILPYLLSACGSSSTTSLNSANSGFLEKYGNQVDKINKDRFTEVSNKKTRAKTSREIDWQNSASIVGVSGVSSYNSAYVDTSKYKLEKEDFQPFFPDVSDLSKKQRFSKFPENAFKVKYNENYYGSYPKYRVDFDDLKIPEQDVYGVDSKLGRKEYVLFSGGVLQENISEIKGFHNEDEKKISQDLILMAKKLDEEKRQQILKVRQEKEGVRRKEIADNLTSFDQRRMERERQYQVFMLNLTKSQSIQRASEIGKEKDGDSKKRQADLATKLLDEK